MADAKAAGADCVVTVGGIQSNHTRCVSGVWIALGWPARA
jgi:1-aminocyclopropane-1-carboxylate deaminase/D-cysteine desulfhydrase-like pyridoxal-dependent ACC family enzyme